MKKFKLNPKFFEKLIFVLSIQFNVYHVIERQLEKELHRAQKNLNASLLERVQTLEKALEIKNNTPVEVPKADSFELLGQIINENVEFISNNPELCLGLATIFIFGFLLVSLSGLGGGNGSNSSGRLSDQFGIFTKED